MGGCFGWSVGLVWLVGWLAGLFAGWLVGWLVGRDETGGADDE